jgi:hypothetical protein
VKRRIMRSWPRRSRDVGRFRLGALDIIRGLPGSASNCRAVGSVQA